MTTTRDILNRARWKDAGLAALDVHVLHRGAPDDRRVVSGKRILGIRPHGIELAPEDDEGVTLIPYHRFLAIQDAEGNTLWSKGAAPVVVTNEIETGIDVVSRDEEILVIDGSAGEGGGQILRTSLALSIAMGRSFVIENIRANRKKPGLARQHVTCVLAAAHVCGANVSGAELGSTRLEFRPNAVRATDTTFDIGSAGATALVVQTIAYALAHAPGTSRIVIKGGTHATMAPPYPFLERAWLPLVKRAGLDASLGMRSPGFYPAGGGEIELVVSPSDFVPLHVEPPAAIDLDMRAIVSSLSEDIGRREVDAATEALPNERIRPVVETVRALGKGNAMWLAAGDASVTNVFSGIGEIGVRAEDIGRRVALAYAAWRDSGAAVDEHLADQLMLPIALGGSGTYTTNALTLHSRTNIEVIRAFTGLQIRANQLDDRRVRISL